MNIYVGNFSYDLNDNDLRELFEEFGSIESVAIIKDKYSGESKGFGFVEMASQKEALAAIEGLNGVEYKGRTLSVNEARPRTDNRGGGGGRGGRDHRGGGGGGGGKHGRDNRGKGGGGRGGRDGGRDGGGYRY